MTSMKTLMLGLSAAALTIGGVACAQAPANNAAAAQKPRMERPKMDADGDGVITRAEAQARATQLFAKLDVNKDGKLDKADRELMHQQMREKMFAKLDTNGDGSISKAEFMADRGPDGRGPDGRGPDGRGPDGPGADSMDGPPPPPPGGEHDGMRGGEHRGKMGRGGHHRGPGHFGGPRGGMMMEKQADTNNDGAVSQAEFVAAALKRFDAQDANHDGKVTKEERQAARKAHMEERKARWETKKADKKAAN
ncbi:EF-hand domain-containing protein [Novosphingobium guangzhouense]|uniref:EF-hand domain-containing protein n=1 Tax=Novosphingobium guangzhouense TaxID=1850347 RepID=A0A2K2FYZ5_9SPHN|nr:EF-hand domain-containing protein [Novosphingobium guangzhouense]PNU03974.1 hypothetical protein A8V01_04980 [Novosphingobium guangzhouense]